MTEQGTPEVAFGSWGTRGTDRWNAVVRGGLVGTGGRIATLVLSVVVTPFAIVHAGNTIYGLFAALTAFATLLTFADFGIGNGVIGEIVTARSRGDAETEQRVVATALAVLLGGGLLVGVAGAVLAYTIPWRHLLNGPAGSEGELRVAVLAAALAMMVSVPAALASKIYLGRQAAGRANLWASAAAASGSVALAIAVVAGHRLPAMVAAQLGAPAIVGAVALRQLTRAEGYSLRPQLVSRSVARALLKTGRLFAFLQVVAVVNFEIDNLVIARLLGPADVTRFAATARLFAIPITLTMMALTPLWAAFADAHAHDDHHWLRTAYLRATRGAVLVLVPIAVILLLTGRWLVEIWTTHAVRPPESLVVAFSVWLVLLALNQPQAMLLNALHDEKFQMIAASANLVANVALSVVFTRLFGVSGPIWGTVVAQLVCALIPSTLRIRALLVRSDP